MIKHANYASRMMQYLIKTLKLEVARFTIYFHNLATSNLRILSISLLFTYFALLACFAPFARFITSRFNFVTSRYYRTSSKRCLDSSRHRAILESGRRMARLSTPLILKIWATREYFADAGKAKSFHTVMDRITNIMKNVEIMLDL